CSLPASMDARQPREADRFRGRAMAEQGEATESRSCVRYRTMDIVVAAILMAVGALVMVGSYQLGAGWSPSGPESGYFPFYVGALILVSSTVTLLITLFSTGAGRT